MLSPDTIRVITYRRWAEGGCDKCGGEEKCGLVLVRKSERKRPHGRHIHKRGLILKWVVKNRK